MSTLRIWKVRHMNDGRRRWPSGWTTSELPDEWAVAVSAEGADAIRKLLQERSNLDARLRTEGWAARYHFLLWIYEQFEQWLETRSPRQQVSLATLVKEWSAIYNGEDQLDT